MNDRFNNPEISYVKFLDGHSEILQKKFRNYADYLR